MHTDSRSRLGQKTTGLTAAATAVAMLSPDVVTLVGGLAVLLTFLAALLVLPAVWSRKAFRREASTKIVRLALHAIPQRRPSPRRR
jgi:hypothetical protein